MQAGWSLNSCICTCICIWNSNLGVEFGKFWEIAPVHCDASQLKFQFMAIKNFICICICIFICIYICIFMIMKILGDIAPSSLWCKPAEVSIHGNQQIYLYLYLHLPVYLYVCLYYMANFGRYSTQFIVMQAGWSLNSWQSTNFFWPLDLIPHGIQIG